MNCDGVRDLLSAYLDGEVSPGELLRVEQHLRRCHACAGEVDSLRQTMSLVASLAEVEVPASFHGQLHQRLVALGPPASAAARLHKADGSRVGNARRWAVPASAAAAVAALAIGLTSMGQVRDLGPNVGIKGPVSIIPGVIAQNPPNVTIPPGPPVTGGPDHVIPPPVIEPVLPPVTIPPNSGDKTTPVTPPSGGGGTAPSTDVGSIDHGAGAGGAGVDLNPGSGPKPVVQAKWALASKAKVTADPAKLNELKAKYLVRQDLPNGFMIVVPAKDHDAVVADVKLLWPAAEVVDQKHDIGGEIKQVEEHLVALRSELEQVQKMPKSEQEQKDARMNSLKTDIETQTLTLDALNQQLTKAYITIEPTP